MQCLLAIVGRLLRSDDGQDLIEYGLVALLISVGAFLVLTSLGSAVYNVLWEPIVQNI